MLAFGTRPEAIKMAPLIHKLKSEPDFFDVQICVTAQHRQLLDQVLETFEIIPDFDLDIMTANQSLHDITVQVLTGMKNILESNKPEILLVHGDTTTTFAAAVAGFFAGVPIGHVEAGLRTYDLQSPFPEEFNRQLTSRVAKWHFAPTIKNKENLISEKVESHRITVTGNTVIDALHWITEKLNCDVSRSKKVDDHLDDILKFNWKYAKFILVTGHRRENFGDGIKALYQSLNELAEKFKDVHFVFPLHFNPNVRTPDLDMVKDVSNIHLIEPVDYEPFVRLLKYCYLVLTDSGGIQEEAPSFGKPVLVMRDVTERTEALEAGTVSLVGTSRVQIVNKVSALLLDQKNYKKMSTAINPYGDGKACDRILQTLKNEDTFS